MRQLKPANVKISAWSLGTVVCLGLALFCFERQIRATVAEETDAGSWERAVIEEKAKADGVPGTS